VKKKWGKVERGEVVELGGREWTVEKTKLKGKKLRVTVRSGSHRAESKVDPADKVTIAEARSTKPPARSKKPKPPPTSPPKPATGDPWETQQDRIERKLGQILGARLVGESTDTDAGYYVPNVDVTTVAAHLAIFHGEVPEQHRSDEAALVGFHAREHIAAEAGDRLFDINHWHTEKRPTTGKKKGKK